MQVYRHEEGEIRISLLGALGLMGRKLHWILLGGLLAAVLVLLCLRFLVTPQYTASVTMYANNSSEAERSTSISTGDLNASAKLVDTYAVIIQSDPVMDEVLQRLDLDMSAEKLARRLSIRSVNGTEVFKVSVEYPDAQSAMRIADAIADIAPAQIASIVDGCSIKIVSRAKLPVSFSSPNYSRNLILGFLLGCIAVLIYLFTTEFFDTRIKRAEDLERWDIPLLGDIPQFEAAAKGAAFGYGKRIRREQK